MPYFAPLISLVTPMLLSILLPLYNGVPMRLITALHTAAEMLLAPAEWEICCLDDHSPHEEAWRAWLHAPLSRSAQIRSTRAEQNLGRSRARNRLAQQAQGRWLLFLDGDMGFDVDEEQAQATAFLRAYLEAIAQCESENLPRVICGGHRYTRHAPSDENLHLHWLYGSQREVRALAARQLLGGSGFTSSNFCAPRSVLLALPFDEQIRGYGHEDTLWGEAAKGQHIHFLHIDNPLLHEGIERAEVFLQKSLQAVDNLLTLHRNGYPMQRLHIRIFRTALWLRRWRLAWLMRLIFWLFAARWRSHLLHTPQERLSLRRFDLYRLGYLLRIWEDIKS